MTKQGLLIVFSGPSGVGKDTLLHHLLEKDQRCVLSVSATTRAPRPGEVDGVDYFFISRERFGELVARGEMLEYAQYGDNLYGTPRQPVNEQLASGTNVILEIEVQGAMQIKKQHPDAVFIFVMPPDWQTLCTRLQNRGTETSDVLARRLALARAEIRRAAEYDYVLVNDHIERCVEHFSAVITAAGATARHMKQFIEEVACHA